MKINDNLQKMKGTLTVLIVEKGTNRIIDKIKEDNVIVLDSRSAIINAISQPSNNSTITTLKLGDDFGEQMTGNPLLTFSDVDPDTITRDSGSWVTDGFVVGDQITVKNTNINDGEYTVDGVTATVLTLSATDFLNNETNVSGAFVSRGTDTNPIQPVNTYDETTMSVIYTYPSALTIGFPDTQTVRFGATVDGADLMSYYPLENSKQITSMALHTGNGNVFSYKRFSKKSISSLVNLVVSWDIGFA